MKNIVAKYDGENFNISGQEEATLVDFLEMGAKLIHYMLFAVMMDEKMTPVEKEAMIKYTTSTLEFSLLDQFSDYLPGGTKKGLSDTWSEVNNKAN